MTASTAAPVYLMMVPAASGPAGQVKLFESWSRGGSGRMESVLVDVGLLPKGRLAN